MYFFIQFVEFIGCFLWKFGEKIKYYALWELWKKLFFIIFS